MDTVGDLFNMYLSAHKNNFSEIRNFLENNTYLFIQFIRKDGTQYVLSINKNSQQSRIFPSNDFGTMISCSGDATLLFSKQDKKNPHFLSILDLNTNSIHKIDYNNFDSLMSFVVLSGFDETDHVFELKISTQGEYSHLFNHLVYIDTIGNILKKYTYKNDINANFWFYSLAMKKLKLEPAFIGVMYVAGGNQIFKTDSCGQIVANLPNFTHTFTQPNCGKFIPKTNSDDTANSWQFRFYPNPNSGRFTILTPEAGMLDILSATGHVIQSFELSGRSSELELQGLRQGVYLVRFRSSKGRVLSSKLMIY
ncbi:MAG: T9SS type A sorting domain-containing protein [Thermaurantimonas sp.]